MRFHLICDHKWRDLPALVNIKLHLRRLGHRVTIASAKETVHLQPLLQPDCIVFNHMMGTRHNDYARRLREQGIAVVVLPTEGSPQPMTREVIHGAAWKYDHTDLFLSWSEEITRLILRDCNLSQSQIRTVGCPRFDFYRAPWNDLVMPRQALCRDLGLRTDRPIVTCTTKYGFARLAAAGADNYTAWENEIRDFGVMKCLEARAFDYRDLPGIAIRSRDALVGAFLDIARRHPDIQFIVKPHPGEDEGYYRKLAAGANLDNLRVTFGYYIWDILGVTDVLVNQHCTTSIEGWLLGLPVLDVNIYEHELFERPELEAGCRAARTAEEMEDGIVELLENPKIEKSVQDYRAAYIQKWYHDTDGLCCAAVAAELDSFMRARGKTRQVWPGVNFSNARSVAVTGIKYALGVPTDTSLRALALGRAGGRKKQLMFNKTITRRDVAAFEQRLKPLIENLNVERAN